MLGDRADRVVLPATRRGVDGQAARRRLAGGDVEIGARIALAGVFGRGEQADRGLTAQGRSEERTSELQSLMRISYGVFLLKKITAPPLPYNHHVPTHCFNK